jgi:23S rRNA U2552 (ribose-2'-O)-methylase RlmE/FtsJ
VYVNSTLVDVGSGPGTWVKEVGVMDGVEEVIGIDVSPIHHDDCVLNDVVFYLGKVPECLDDEKFNAQSIDLIHSRYRGHLINLRL